MNETRSKPVVVYDGECPFCLAQIARIQRKDRRRLFEYVARQAPGLTDRFPALAQGDFNTGMRLVMPSGAIHVGADAVYEIARRLPFWRRAAWLYRVPVLHAMLVWAYGWVAAHRGSLGHGCRDDACKV